MEQIAVLLLLLVAIGVQVRISFFTRQLYVWIFALFTGVAVILVFPHAIRQNRMFMQTFMSDPVLFNNVMLLFIVEPLLLIKGNLIWAQKYYLDKTASQPSWTKRLRDGLAYHPGFCFLFSLYYFEVRMFLQGWDFDFMFLAMFAALGAILLIIACIYLINRFFREKDKRLELSYYLYVMQMVLAVVMISANTEKTGYFTNSDIHVFACAGMSVFFIICSFASYLFYKKFN
jgi:hypothetical protein